MASNTERADIIYSPVDDKSQNEGKLPLVGVRHWQVLLLFIMVFTAFGFRVILSVAIVAMTDPHASSNPDIPTYNWKDKGTILSAFFWGYILPQILAGYIANRFGAKWFLVTAMSLQSLLAALTPITAAHFGVAGMCVNRALQGLCQGFIYPSVTHQLSQWVPQEERSRLGAFVFGSGPLGTVVAMLVAGVISASWYGWPLVFYIYGGIGVSWAVLFTIWGQNSPAVHPRITLEEKRYIEESLGHSDEKPIHKVPWVEILKSVPVWAVFIVQNGSSFSFWTLLTQIPSYMNHVMKFNIKDNSLLSALPYFTLWLLSFVFGYISDLIINKKLVTIGTARKIFNSMGLLVPAVTLVILGYTDPTQTTKAVVLLVVSVAFNAACMCGFALNHMDLSPNHAGTLMGLTNGFSHCTAILAPIVVQVLVTDESDPVQWRVVFFITSGVTSVVALVFIIFGSGEVQPWNEESGKTEEEKGSE